MSDPEQDDYRREDPADDPVSYWVPVAAELLDELPTEPLADSARFTGRRRPSLLNAAAVDVLVEDPNADPYLDGALVDIVLTRDHPSGDVRITERIGIVGPSPSAGPGR